VRNRVDLIDCLVEEKEKREVLITFKRTKIPFE
jgi:hypothetical protein